MEREAIMSTRDILISRIRQHSNERIGLPAILPNEKSDAEVITNFVERFKLNGGEVDRFESEAALGEWIRSYAARWNITSVVLSDELKLDLGAMPVMFNSSVDARIVLEQRDSVLGIDRALFGVAQSGAVCIAESGSVRWSSMIPAHHVVILSEANIVADLVSCMSSLPNDETITVIAGPSKTADIEKTLITGVHGPGRITVALFHHE